MIIDNDIFVLNEKEVISEKENKPLPPKEDKKEGLIEQVVRETKNPFLRGDEDIEITESPFVIGKDAKCDYIITGDTYISRRHCRIVKRPKGYFIEDLDSTNGTFIDGEQIDKRTKLENGQEVMLADRSFVWEE